MAPIDMFRNIASVDIDGHESPQFKNYINAL